MTTTYKVPDGPKALRETLCVAQSGIGVLPFDNDQKRKHIERLQRLIDACDARRPLGPDGKHGDRHTPSCGCDEVPLLDNATACTICGGAIFWDQDEPTGQQRRWRHVDQAASYVVGAHHATPVTRPEATTSPSSEIRLCGWRGAAVDERNGRVDPGDPPACGHSIFLE